MVIPHNGYPTVHHVLDELTAWTREVRASDYLKPAHSPTQENGEKTEKQEKDTNWRKH